jgi:hypothetical protein
MSDESASDDETRHESEHLSDIQSSCGCAEVWEHLSEQRQS